MILIKLATLNTGHRLYRDIVTHQHRSVMANMKRGGDFEFDEGGKRSRGDKFEMRVLVPSKVTLDSRVLLLGIRQSENMKCD